MCLKAQMIPADGKDGGGEPVCADAAAVFPKKIPLNVLSVSIRKEEDIADLPDAEAAVEEMLEGMADQIEQVVGVRQSGDVIQEDGTPVDIGEEPVQTAVGLGPGREKAPVQLNEQGPFGLPVGKLVVGRTGISVGGQPKACEDFVAFLELRPGDQQILIGGRPVIRQGMPRIFASWRMASMTAFLSPFPIG